MTGPRGAPTRACRIETRVDARVLALLLLTALILPAQDRRVVPAGGGRRLALVIGNDAYPWKPLVNSVRDARSIAQALPDVGFAPNDITLATDTNLRQLQRAARDFLQKLKPDDVALVYYSGHGVEVRGENYLIPVDFPSNSSELDVQDLAYPAQQFLRNLEATGARVRLMILDACRDNPLRATRSAGGGLARMEGQGTLVVFATGAGQTADDNPRGNNGLFTSHLLREMRTPGVSIDIMLKQVARAVYQDSGGKQIPSIYGMLLQDFAFVPGSVAAPASVTPAPPPAPVTNRPAGARVPAPKSQKELQAVQALYTAQSSSPDQTIAAAEALIVNFPESDFKEIALVLEATAFQNKNDLIKAQVYGERALEINPRNYQASLLVAGVIVKTTRENDLDREEKLNRAGKYLADTIDNLNAAAKPNSQMTDSAWEEAKRQLIAQAHNEMGMAALTRRKYDLAANEFQIAVSMDRDPTYLVRQASALQSLGRNDEAIRICDDLLKDSQLHPQIRQAAQGVRAAAVRGGGR